MSIVHRPPEMPEEGSIVEARGRSDMFKDKAGQHIERAIYKDGKFMAGGDFPIPPFELNDVDAWIYERDMFKVHPGGFSTSAVAALIAERLPD